MRGRIESERRDIMTLAYLKKTRTYIIYCIIFDAELHGEELWVGSWGNIS